MVLQNGCLLSQNFQRCRSNPNVYLQQSDGHLIIIVLYVDDLVITTSTVASISAIKTALHNAFETSDLGLKIVWWDYGHSVQIHFRPISQF